MSSSPSPRDADAGELLALLKAQRGRTGTEWAPDLAAALATGDFARAAELYAAIGSLADAAFASLRAAEQLLAAGGRAEGDAHLQRALAFYRQAGATADLRRAEAPLAASA